MNKKTFSIRWKIVLIFSPLILLITISTAYVAIDQLSKRIEREFENRLLNGVEIIKSNFRGHADASLSTSKVLAREPKVSDIVLGNINRMSFRAYLEEMREFTKREYLAVYDLNGTMIIHTSDYNEEGVEPSTRSIITEIAQNHKEEAKGVEIIDGQLYASGSSAIYSWEALRSGIIKSSILISQNEIDNLEKTTGFDIVIHLDKKPIGTITTAVISSDKYKSKTFNLELLGKKDSVPITIGISKSFFQEANKKTINTVVILTIFFIAVAIILSIILSTTILTPLKKLSTGAKKIAEGDFSHNVKINSNDEFKLLANSFNQMTFKLNKSTVSKAYVDAIIDNLKEALFVMNDQWIIERVNKMACQIFAKDEDEFLGQKLSTILNNEAHQFILDIQQRIIYLNKLSSRQIKIKVGSETLYLLLNYSSIEDVFNKKTNIVCTAADITERVLTQKQVEKIQSDLVKVSRTAAIAEMATGILHNIGNAMNSVNVSMGILKAQVKSTKSYNLDKMISLLKKHSDNLGDFFDNNEKGKQIIPYFELFDSMLTDNQVSLLEELTCIDRGIEHINAIIQTQQVNAAPIVASEEIVLHELLENVIKLEENTFIRHEIQIIKDFKECSNIVSERHRIIQIIINLISNAKKSLLQSEYATKTITISVCQNDSWSIIDIADNGVGIKDEQLDKIFAHGFTTFHEGHGFGLHISYFAAQDLGGELSVHNDGNETGARFRLKLPYQIENRPT